jgi:hypothetical protein
VLARRRRSLVSFFLCTLAGPWRVYVVLCVGEVSSPLDSSGSDGSSSLVLLSAVLLLSPMSSSFSLSLSLSGGSVSIGEGVWWVLGVVLLLFKGSAFGVVVSVDLASVAVLDGLVSGGVRFVAGFVGDEGCGGVEEVVCVCSQIVSCLSFSVGVMFGVGALVVLEL